MGALYPSHFWRGVPLQVFSAIVYGCLQMVVAGIAVYLEASPCAPTEYMLPFNPHVVPPPRCQAPLGDLTSQTSVL